MFCPWSDVPCFSYTAIPSRISSAGIGWMLTLGKLIDPDESLQFHPRWTYVAPDGSEHEFHDTLHEGETAQTGIFYTRSGSYMRMLKSDTAAVLEMADGTRHWFVRHDAVNHLWRLDFIEDHYSNLVDIAYDTMPPPDYRARWTISDSTGRTHYVYFNAQHKHVESVDLAAFNGARALYTFTYEFPKVRRNCLDNSSATSDYLNDPPVPGTENTVPLLVTVTQPDLSTWRMTDATGSGYYLCCGSGCTAGPACSTFSTGSLRRLYGPPGGGIEWVYTDVIYDWEEPFYFGGAWEPRPDYLYWSGVTTRRLIDASGSVIANSTSTYSTGVHPTWSPSTIDGNNYRCGLRPEERWTIATAPDTNASVHYFGAYPGITGRNQSDYGLNATGRVADPLGEGRYLSVRRFQGTVAVDVDGDTCVPSQLSGGQCSPPLKVPLRTEYRSYFLDGYGAMAGHRHTNRHLLSERTVYEDTKYATTTQSEFDGLGHFARVTTAGTFGAANAQIHITNFNPTKRYPAGTIPPQWWPSSDPWVINTYTDTKTTIDSGAQARTAKRAACFNAGTGALIGTRVFKDTGTGGTDPAPHANDVIVRYLRDLGGVLYGEEYFGGDTGSVDPGQALCTLLGGMGSGAAGYRIAHTYRYGALETTRYLDTSGNALPFDVVDRDIDLSTSLPSASYEASAPTKDTPLSPSGVLTSYEYDAMGRLVWAKPASGQGSWVEYVHTNASGSTPASVQVYQRPNGSTSGELSYARYTFDAHGRLVKENQKLHSGSLNQRLTEYNAMSWKTAVSEWQPDGTSGGSVKKTQYLTFDPFGRPATIRPPDGSTHDVTFVYTGISKIDRTVKIATAQGSETTSTTSEEYDRQGRLWKVTEPSGTAGANVTTTYTYDVGNRLKQASTTSGSTQNRIFTYDNRGFLTTEQLPEKGTSGNGIVTYSNYDARGHALRMQDGPNDLTFVYDRAERLTDVTETSTGRIVKKLYYDLIDGTTRGYSRGKLARARADNYYNGTNNFQAVETYTYSGVAGRVSARTTCAGGTWNDPFTCPSGTTFNQSFTWTDLGAPASVVYPDNTATALDPARTVTYTYTNGSLTAVPSFATSISYHSNTMVNAVTHANGVVDTYGADANAMQRPASITTTYASQNWGSGAYGYDGAGNVKTVGADYYIYDKVSRLVEGAPRAATKKQRYSYDGFGNMTKIETWNGSTWDPKKTTTSVTTNRIQGTCPNPITTGDMAASYDAAGNLTSWNRCDVGVVTNFAHYQSGLLRTLGTTRNYRYTADGERLATWDGTKLTFTLRGLDNKVLRVFDLTGTTWSWVKDYIYRGGLHLAEVESGFPTEPRHFSLDHLGTIRLITRNTGTYVNYHAYYGFGEEAATTADGEAMKFTGHERDLQGTITTPTDDLDYMHARYYNPNIARFLSVDPGRDVDPKTPQSWNLYSYVRNNPTNLVDPDGRMAWRKVISIFKYLIKEREYIKVANVQGNTKRKTVAGIREGLDTVQPKKGEVARVVRTEDQATSNTVATALDPRGRMRGPESAGGLPEHVHPKSGPYSDVHIESIGGLAAIGAIVAPFSQSLARDPNASKAEIAAAAAWDITSTLDPVGVTDLINYLFDLQP